MQIKTHNKISFLIPPDKQIKYDDVGLQSREGTADSANMLLLLEKPVSAKCLAAH